MKVTIVAAAACRADGTYHMYIVCMSDYMHAVAMRTINRHRSEDRGF